MNDADLKQILSHKDRTIERQSKIIKEHKQLIALITHKLALAYLENDILKGEKLNNIFEDEQNKVHTNQIMLKL